MKTFPVRNVPASSLRAFADNNPNDMKPHEVKALAAFMKEHGFLQPILVREVHEGDAQLGPTFYDWIDGEHRLEAIRLAFPDEATVPAVVLPPDTTDEECRKIRIAIQRLRGNPDLVALSAEFRKLVDDGVAIAEIAITGYAEDEIADLLASAQPRIEDVLEDAQLPSPEPEEEPREAKGSFDLVISFAKKGNRARALKELKKLAGKGNALEAGLLRALFDE